MRMRWRPLAFLSIDVSSCRWMGHQVRAILCCVVCRLTLTAGETSNATIEEASTQRLPPLYFLSDHKLYQYTNESYISPVSILNSTESEEDPMPYKVVIGSEREAVSGISWTWRGPNLHADYPATNRSNLGLFYSCKNTHGRYGTYLHLDDGSNLRWTTGFRAGECTRND